MLFPKQAPLGNSIPESASETGYAFPERLWGKLRPALRWNTGTQFPAQTEEGALPAVDAGSAPIAQDFVEG